MYPNKSFNTHPNHSSDSAHVDTQAHENSHPRDSESQSAVPGTNSACGPTTVVPSYSSNVFKTSNGSSGSGIAQVLNTECTGSALPSISRNLETRPKDLSGQNYDENCNVRSLNAGDSNMVATGNPSAWSSLPTSVTNDASGTSSSATVGSSPAFPKSSQTPMNHGGNLNAFTSSAAVLSNSQGTFMPIAPSLQQTKVSVPNPLASSVPNPLAAIDLRPLNHPNVTSRSSGAHGSSFQGTASNTMGSTRVGSHPTSAPLRTIPQAPNHASFQGTQVQNSEKQNHRNLQQSHSQLPASQSTGGIAGSDGLGCPVQNQAPKASMPRRKLVLSKEGREALTKAVVSSLKDPRGMMDPVLLEGAMRITQLSREAILNAAKLAREKENQKRRAHAAAMVAASGGVSQAQVRRETPQQQQQQHQQQLPSISHSNQSRATSQPQVYAHSRPQTQMQMPMQTGSQLQMPMKTESQKQMPMQSGPQGSLQSRPQPQSQMQSGMQSRPQTYMPPGSQSQSQINVPSGSKSHVSMQQQQPIRSESQPETYMHSSSQPHTVTQVQSQVHAQPRSQMPMAEPRVPQAHQISRPQGHITMQMQPRSQIPSKESDTRSKNMAPQSGMHGQSHLQARQQSQSQLPPPTGARLQNLIPRQQGYQSHVQFKAGSNNLPQSMNTSRVPRPLDSKSQKLMPIRAESRPQSSSYSQGYAQPRTHSMPQAKPHFQAGASVQGKQQSLATRKATVPYSKIQHTPQPSAQAVPFSQASSHAQHGTQIQMKPRPTFSSSQTMPSTQKPLPQTQPQSQNQSRTVATPKKPTSPTKFELQMKAAKEAAVTFHQEISQWKRIQHGLFLTAAEGNVQQVPIKTCSLGAISRISDVQPVLKTSSTSQSIDEALKERIIELQREVRAAGRVDGVAPKDSLIDSSPVSVVTSLFSHRFTNTKINLTDVTEKHKRIKLQSRKDSRALERNLRKHRHVVCELLLKKHKELNRSILQHSTDFYKFHRQRKAELSKFSKSVRDYVAAEQRKKEKDVVNEEKARIAALKANDMEAYSALVQETRNDRLKFLLNKTDEYIDQISGLLKDQHDGKVISSEPTKDNSGGVELFGGSRLPAVEEPNSNYYKTAHVHKEDVKQPSILVGGKLKEYQLSGLQWLVSLYNNKLNGILADEMGLGKTVQTIALISYLMEFKDNRGPYLVIVPLSTLSNWVNEFRRWCPTATVVVYKGTPAQRKGLYKSEVIQGHFNVLLTTYEYIIKDKSSLRKLQWEYAIVDEGHRMKNSQSKFAVTLGTQYVTKHRVLLTGTPLQNSLPELWSLLNFLLPSIFNSAETFDQWFNKPFAQFGTSTGDGDTEETVNNEERLLIIQRLHELLRPFMLRRIKSDVLDQLPDKVEKVLRCELSSWQKELYKQISYSVLEDGQKKSKRGLNNVVMQLRKVCNHPYMFTPEGYYITEDIIRTSGKFELLDRMLPKLKAAGHRILMFFQMTAAMTIMEDYLKYRNILSLRLDGSTTGEERERRMDLFNAPNSPYFIFMLSTRAGGLGLNLVSADTVIIFDSDWNPMMDLQAQDRAHRIGQKKIVSVFRLITNSPVEEKILSRATEKLNMSELVVEAGKFDRDSVEEDNAEERQKIMEILLTDFDTTAAKGSATGTTSSLPTSEDDMDGNGESDEKEEIDINELLSRNDEDYEFYSKMDSGETYVEDYFKSPGLVTDPDDIPDWIRYPHGKKEQGDGEFDDLFEAGKRRAASKATAYDDGLTEKQFLRIMEKQAEVEEEEAKARKREWKLARDKKAVENAVNARSTSTSPLSEDTCNRLVSMTRSIIAIRDPKTNRRYSDIFREKPSEDDYPEYYKLIQQPIAINDILKKCRTKSYASPAEYHQDWKMMFSNAVKFNGEDSWVVMDGKVLEVELNRLLKKYGLLEDASKMAASSPKKKKPRLKLSLKLSLKRKNESESTSNDSKKTKIS